MRMRIDVTTAMLVAALVSTGGAARAQDSCADPLFGPEILLAGESNYAWAVFDADLDGDGDVDVLSASKGDDKIAWYRNEGGTIGLQQVISSELYGASGVSAADLDGDGDLDVLGASGSAGKIVWSEQVEVGEFGPARVVTGLAQDVTSICPADLDGDGDTDVLLSSYSVHRIAWCANDGTGDFGALKIITPFADYAYCATAADLDGDGDLDVLWAEAGDDVVAWMPNEGRGDFGPELDIDDMATIAGPTWVDAADLDGDGDLDVLAAMHGEGRVAWYENDGLGGFGPAQNITTAAASVRCVLAADVDGDGDADVLSASQGDDKVAWYENTDGLGTFGPQLVITTAADGTRSVRAADLDGDGVRDVIVASPFDHTVAWFANDGQGGFGPEIDLTTTVLGASDAAAADIDGDGDLDALTASPGDDKVAWYENLDGLGSFGVQQVVTSSAEYVRSVTPGDIDGDGDIDLVSASFGDKTLAWYRNLDGQGTFGPEQMISSACSGHVSALADIDGDGDLDAATNLSNPGATVAWFENVDGTGAFGLAKLVTIGGQATGFATISDLDGDSDADLVVTTYVYPNVTLHWLENSGAGSFGTSHVIATSLEGGLVASAADVDDDGDLDLLCCTNNDHVVMWFENTDGHGSFGALQLIWTSTGYYPRDVVASDVDGDGDLDAISVSWIESQLAWYANTDGEGAFGPQQHIPTSLYEASSAFTADLNGDGQQDLLYTGTGNSKAAWMSIRPMTPILSPVGTPLSGTMGDPLLTGSSCLASNTWLNLKLAQAAPDSPAVLVIGLSELAAPLKGGVLVPFPNFLLPVSTSSHGTHSLVVQLPANVPADLDVFFQYWIVDPGGPKGFAASNGLTGVTQ